MVADITLTLFAHLFNRGQIVITILLSLFVGSFTYDLWLQNLGFKPIETVPTNGEAIRLGAVFML